MRGKILFGILFLSLNSGLVLANDTYATSDDNDNSSDDCRGGVDRRGHRCKPRGEPRCFNIVCQYKSHSDRDGFKSCKAAATFVAKVTRDGGEIEGDSEHPYNPELQITCDGETVYNNSAHRFTDLLGTRIQGQSGPFPAVILPRGALHSGSEHSAGYHVSESVLELEGKYGFTRTKGECQIWTGNP